MKAPEDTASITPTSEFTGAAVRLDTTEETATIGELAVNSFSPYNRYCVVLLYTRRSPATTLNALRSSPPEVDVPPTAI